MREQHLINVTRLVDEIFVNLRAHLQSKSCLTVLQAAVPILEWQWNQNQWTRTIGEVNNLGNNQIQKVGNDWQVLLHREQN